MQLTLPIDGRHRIFVTIDKRLRDRFGRPGPWLPLDPVSQLVIGIIGGRTRGAVSLRAFEALIRRFRTWDRVRDAPEAEIYETIQAVTFAEVKAGRLKAALRAVTAARGRLTLDFLRRWAVVDALMWLERLPGVGRKTAAATLNFSTLRMNALVIDTHHLRVLQRLGLVGRRAIAREAYERVMPYLPAAWNAEAFDDHHQLIKTLGQRICRDACPICRACPLSDLCRTATDRSRRGRKATGAIKPRADDPFEDDGRLSVRRPTSPGLPRPLALNTAHPKGNDVPELAVRPPSSRRRPSALTR